MQAEKAEIVPSKPAASTAEIEAAFSNLPAAAQKQLEGLRRNSQRSVRARHADTTADNYDYWWGRYLFWLEHPGTRLSMDALPAMNLETLQTLGPNHPVVEGMTVAWLQELTYGGNDNDAAIAEWFEDDNGMSPNSFSTVVASLKARFSDQTRQKWVVSAAYEDELTGMRRTLREWWGKEGRATPLLGRHVAAIAASISKTAHHTGSPRELLIAELSAAGLTPAEIGRLPYDPVAFADQLTAETEAASEELFRSTGQVGMDTLVVPGQSRKGGKQDPPKLVVLHEHSTLRLAVDAYVCDDERTEAQHEEGRRWFIHGFADRQRSNLMRQVLVDVARKAGSDWTPTRSAPAMPADVLDAVRTMLRNGNIEGTRQKAVVRRAKRDLAMLWIGFYGCLRRSELLALTVGDLVPVEGMHRFVAEIRKSKTDQAGEGVSLVIPGDPNRDPHRDPVACIVDWMDELKEAHGGVLAANTVLFPAIEHDATLGNGSLGGQAFSDRLRLLAERAGLKEELSEGGLESVTGHSLRRGYITTAALLGRGPLEIQNQSRHKDVNVLARYVESVTRQTADVLVSVDDLVV